MSTQGGGPPNKYKGISTAAMLSVDELAQALSNAWAEGFTGEPIVVPSPDNSTSTWIAIPGYKKEK